MVNTLKKIIKLWLSPLVLFSEYRKVNLTTETMAYSTCIALLRFFLQVLHLAIIIYLKQNGYAFSEHQCTMQNGLIH